jgi:hypothetical protein
MQAELTSRTNRGTKVSGGAFARREKSSRSKRRRRCVWVCGGAALQLSAGLGSRRFRGKAGGQLEAGATAEGQKIGDAGGIGDELGLPSSQRRAKAMLFEPRDGWPAGVASEKAGLCLRFTTLIEIRCRYLCGGRLSRCSYPWRKQVMLWLRPAGCASTSVCRE